MGRGPCLFVAAACVALTAPAVPHAAAVDYPVFHEIGPLPLAAVTAPGSALGRGPEGQPWLYLVSSGSPAVLSVVDARTGQREHEFPLPGAAGSWAVGTAPNGDVYVLRPSATYLGSLHADADGTLSHRFTVPGDSSAGENRVEIKRVLTGRAVTADLTVSARPEQTEHDTVVFGEVDSRVSNDARENGCTFLDEVWLDAPFAGHGDFVRTVRGLASAWRADGLFTARESRAVAAARSDAGR
jgi:hypothetical protein